MGEELYQAVLAQQLRRVSAEAAIWSIPQ